MINNKIFQAQTVFMVKEIGWWGKIRMEAGRIGRKLLKLSWWGIIVSWIREAFLEVVKSD